MSRQTKDRILMSIVAIIFFLNMILLQFFVSVIKELMVVGWGLLAIGARGP